MKTLLTLLISFIALSTVGQVPLKYVGLMQAYDPDGDSLDWEIVDARPEGASWMITPYDGSSARLWMTRMEKAEWQVDVKVTDPGELYDMATMFVSGGGCDTLEYFEISSRDTTIQIPKVVTILVDSTYQIHDTTWFLVVPIPQPCLYDTIPK